MKVYLAYTPSEYGDDEVRKVFKERNKALLYLDIYNAQYYGEKWSERELEDRVKDLLLQVEEHDLEE